MPETKLSPFASAIHDSKAAKIDRFREFFFKRIVKKLKLKRTSASALVSGITKPNTKPAVKFGGITLWVVDDPAVADAVYPGLSKNTGKVKVRGKDRLNTPYLIMEHVSKQDFKTKVIHVYGSVRTL